jgi:hypothetical protein
VEAIRQKSFIRVIITITTALAVVALFFRNWLFVFWKDFNNSKELQSKLLELELNPQQGDEPVDPDTMRRNRVLSIIRRRKKFIENNKTSHFSKWLTLIFSTECLFEICLLVIHPFPYLEEEYTFKILNMLGAKD